MTQLSNYILPLTMVLIVGYGMWKKVPVFDCFLEGAREGLTSAVQILPALIALITAVGMFKASGALDLLTAFLRPLFSLLRLPDAVIPLALLRPISGSGAMVIFQDILQRSGPDSFAGRVASVMQGSTETTFYTIAVYFGATKVIQTRHTLPSALTADIVGFIMSAAAVRILLGE
ncbi:MAG: spore maturation protein [Oscillospiraceae bacterium]|nr:spore maturation protein [Oscillospiraceae bacterium]